MNHKWPFYCETLPCACVRRPTSLSTFRSTWISVSGWGSPASSNARTRFPSGATSKAGKMPVSPRPRRGPNPRLLRHEGTALHRVFNHVNPAVKALIEKSPAVGRPDRSDPAFVRHRPFGALRLSLRGERHDVDLEAPRLARRVCHPAAVRRDGRCALRPRLLQ